MQENNLLECELSIHANIPIMDTTIEITGLSKTVIEKLDERAEKIGATTPDYVRYLIERDLESSMSLRMLFAPVREQISEQGISDEELEKHIDTAIAESRKARRQT